MGFAFRYDEILITLRDEAGRADTSLRTIIANTLGPISRPQSVDEHQVSISVPACGFSTTSGSANASLASSFSEPRGPQCHTESWYPSSSRPCLVLKSSNCITRVPGIETPDTRSALSPDSPPPSTYLSIFVKAHLTCTLCTWSIASSSPPRTCLLRVFLASRN